MTTSTTVPQPDRAWVSKEKHESDVADLHARLLATSIVAGFFLWALAASALYQAAQPETPPCTWASPCVCPRMTP